ncbi:hypothetical protein FKX85_15340 [Echinicola soli]|uniref:Uncharacterized protein n=1 Tax=Echinicola soli TaxID=2591634 RepID=A0A514CKJ6_9BACT|nr:hypothetical protein [Echinicola soli]QDH80336.1 hypothetical protein FKX85_15340 [Echinicola soli]
MIIDKTVADVERQEHRSIFWVLKHLRYKNSHGEYYNYKEDYLGYFPDEESKEKSLDILSSAQIDSINNVTDIVYIADNYGVYESDFLDVDNNISPKIYGGLTQKDLDLLVYSIASGKLVFAEFNSMGAPTSKYLRSEFENLFDIKWSGWISRYFDEMDTVINEEIPEWLISNYNKQHDEDWNFQGAGQIFVSEFGQIEVFKVGVDITVKVPKVISPLASQSTYGLPKEANYPYWFEILRIDRSYEVISYFDLGPTQRGVEKLKALGLPRYFPASITRKVGDARIYYFTGDFADNPVSMETATFYGVPTLSKLANEKDDYSNRTSFFWNYYLPLMTKALSKQK